MMLLVRLEQRVVIVMVGKVFSDGTDDGPEGGAGIGEGGDGGVKDGDDSGGGGGGGWYGGGGGGVNENGHGGGGGGGSTYYDITNTDINIPNPNQSSYSNNYGVGFLKLLPYAA
jgi:hypothetical protein